LPEEAASPRLFQLLVDFLRLTAKRNSGFDTLVLAFMLHAMKIWGVAPELDVCSSCGAEQTNHFAFNIKHGGVVCDNCASINENLDKIPQDELLYMVNFDIVKVLKYLLENPLTFFKSIALEDGMARKLRMILKEHARYHLEISKLKTDSFMEPAAIRPLDNLSEN
jgi:DNA repair protein RecO (recombination protein O)